MLDRSDHFFLRVLQRAPRFAGIAPGERRGAPEELLPTLGESSEEDARRLHSYTVTENERILAAEFPLQGQHDNERLHEDRGFHGRFHNAKPLSPGKFIPGTGPSCVRRASNSRTAGRARRAASAPAAKASSTREKSFQSMWCTGGSRRMSA